MDFVADGLIGGRRLRCLTIVDDCTRECLAIEVDASITGLRVHGVLDRLADMRALPQSITVDNGPEFDSQVLDKWAYRSGVRLSFIRPGKPNENAYIESFNGKFRDECLNEHWFIPLPTLAASLKHGASSTTPSDHTAHSATRRHRNSPTTDQQRRRARILTRGL
jgi:putative transposase